MVNESGIIIDLGLHGMVLVPMEWNGTTTMLPPTTAFDNWTRLHIKDLLLRIYIVRSYNTPPESKRWQHATGINASIIFTWRHHHTTPQALWKRIGA